LPAVPTLSEAGVPGVDLALWFALYAPSGTPAGVIEWLNRELNAALRSADVREKLAAQGFDPRPGSPKDLGDLMLREQPLYARVVAESKITVD